MTIKVYIPNIGNDKLEVTDIMVKIEDTVLTDQPLAILEGDKTSIEVPSPSSGIVKSIMINIGDKVNTGSLIMLIENTEITKKTTIPIKNNQNNTPINQNNTTIIHHHDQTIIHDNKNHIHATPLIRHMARIFGINLKHIHGTGRKGRILREDIQNYIKNNIQNINKKTINQHTQSKTFNNIAPWPRINFDEFGPTEKIKLKHIQKTSGANLHRNWIMLPHVTQFDEVDITELEKFRKEKNEEAEKEKLNFKITPIIFIMKAVALTLKKLPRFNSSLSENNHTLILKKYINIGIAVNTHYGLIVPVIKDVNKKNIITLTKELSNILQKTSNNNQLVASDMQGGCFTISSLGKTGGTAFTPIVNVPEVAILGVSRASIKPIWNGKKFSPRLMLPLSLSYDHRVINGVDGAQFMNIINKLLSDIRNLIM
ncbi:2-oxo acid dehydrogenase subunit E2 [Blochmannia endosymbiont of Polyrhachis (Hedomyrma) turneri]|uniref:2-oxo acid dehydrogenase subunit E2 n=1 Tax=Blochmannia endosymbiont of Polyrhachis (Hedomyrma) turneri TaxID=1505596 RepID=UPI00061A5B16|nr:2-oxo acid dehydrogenase subunit E2 [Blochmannia endosymbiont of Polyrhachis (Hedomyrma) turneri]AKC59736.1 Dihydrolipoyllysine-residue acetyltransferase component of pyruvate dehydrogenase complex [Blochmannia endosymbiont of Polyrhachis (Hedomyrma) turneri]